MVALGGSYAGLFGDGSDGGPVMSMHDAFTRAYKDGQWHNGSGSGSSAVNTREYRRFLQDYMRGHAVRSVLDIGCGDWQFSRLVNWTGIAYLGVDLVPDVITADSIAYGHRGAVFACADILDVAVLPAADLILVKDLLQHWPDTAIERLRGQLAGRRALLTYDHAPAGAAAPDTPPGGYRPLDLTRPPYDWPVREVLRYEAISHEGSIRRVKTVMELAP